MTQEPLRCPHCNFLVAGEDYFCPQCGKKLKDKPPSTSLWRQAVVYAIAILLPPFGLWPAVHYLQQNDDVSKRIGIVAVILTIVSSIASIFLAIGIVNSLNTAVSSLTNLGY